MRYERGTAPGPIAAASGRCRDCGSAWPTWMKVSAAFNSDASPPQPPPSRARSLTRLPRRQELRRRPSRPGARGTHRAARSFVACRCWSSDCPFRRRARTCAGKLLDGSHGGSPGAVAIGSGRATISSTSEARLGHRCRAATRRLGRMGSCRGTQWGRRRRLQARTCVKLEGEGRPRGMHVVGPPSLRNSHQGGLPRLQSQRPISCRPRGRCP